MILQDILYRNLVFYSSFTGCRSRLPDRLRISLLFLILTLYLNADLRVRSITGSSSSSRVICSSGSERRFKPRLRYSGV